MVDFSVFDSILDSAFVVDGNGQVVYANDAASTFCQVSLRRMIGKANISDLFALELSGIFPFLETSLGRFEATAFIETHVQVKKMGTPRRVQLAIRPLGGERWALFLRDLTLEEALHNKYRSQLREKEEYAKNLEKIVEARTAELRSQRSDGVRWMADSSVSGRRRAGTGVEGGVGRGGTIVRSEGRGP